MMIKAFQEKDAFHLHIILARFAAFRPYHIEIFQKEYKKFFYASNNVKWHQHYIQEHLWTNDSLMKLSPDHEFGVDLMTWPEHFFKARESLHLSHGFSRIEVDLNFTQIIHIGLLHENMHDISHIFDQLKRILEKDQAA